VTTEFAKSALRYHEHPLPGKIATEITKPASTPSDLALAYSPGVAEPVKAIARRPEDVYRYTGKGNLVAVITDGSAILGLGNLGPLASKPVMEGKALLFKRFADINAVDIEVKARNADEFVDTVERIADTFGGINLEDIKAPECFDIEQRLIAKCDIPVFHDDQHGTAIVTAAGLLNALEIQGKSPGNVKIVCLGAGAAAYACMNLLCALGLQREQIVMVDRLGVIYKQRPGLNQHKLACATASHARTLDDALKDADVLIGLSGANLVSADQILMMAPNPVIFACSNPEPEIAPALVKAVRPDAIMATGRSDFPNQVNNVLAFPFIFRGALDVRASCINEPMKLAAVDAIRDLAKLPIPADLLALYGLEQLSFGQDYIIPMPLDPRLLTQVAPAVAQAAQVSGVSRLQAYRAWSSAGPMRLG
jgi:malate dehydrogenase (oxaloacetate-decarboxylating)(NADP+)